ncbi:proline--tRNA ligase, partial [Chloroflexota bacterium]
LVAGYASLIGLKGIKVIADDSITLGQNFVVGANKPDAHIKNANYPRDFQVDIVTDIARAGAGQPCPRCGKVMETARGVEVGHIFKLGTIFSQMLGAFYLDGDGVQKPVVMGCYGIGIGRLLAAIIEHSHDEKGVIWPASIAPYQVHICALGTDDDIVLAAEKLYTELEEQGIEVLFDDRPESAGVKFNDADLLGVPVRLTVSRRTLKSDSVEIKLREQESTELMSLNEVSKKLCIILNSP